MTGNFLSDFIITYSMRSCSDKKNWLIMIKMFTNTNKLMQRKTLFYTCRYCVCSDTINYFANSPRLTLTLQHLNSLQYVDQFFSCMNSFLNYWTISNVQNLYFAKDTQVLVPRNSKILFYKRCLDYTSKHLIWLRRFYKPKPNMKVFEKNFTNIHKLYTKATYSSLKWCAFIIE